MDEELIPLFTPESLAICCQANRDSCRLASEMYEHNSELRSSLENTYPAFHQWIKALEDQDLASATQPEIWEKMLEQDLIC